MNNVTLIGNLATDVEVREVGNDKKVATFVLAVDRPGQDKGADFVRVATWDRQAEVCGEYLAKGKRVAVDGRLKSRSWEDADGKRRSAVE
ncbi:MAG TPA: single-stranded DNA-binding protein, partial [Gaiellaceae bacterium]|nr:single-stranded DNA-binding protein [Gaiellaceae bacterium]